MLKLMIFTAMKSKIPDVSIDYGMKNMPCHYAEHVKNGSDIMEMLTLDANMDIMVILDGAIKSSKLSKEEKIISCLLII